MRQKFMKLISSLLVFAMLVTSFSADTVFAAGNSDEENTAETVETTENENIITVEASDNLEEYLSENNKSDELYRLVVTADDGAGDIDDVLDDTSGVTDYIITDNELVIEFESEEELESAKENLDSSDSVTDYWEDKIISDALCDDTSWGTELMGLSTTKNAYESTYDDSDVITVAVIDSGINDSNSVFFGRISSDSITYDGDTLSDSLGHGTAVAGIIAECTPSNVELLIIDAFDEKGESTIYTLRTAISYAIECGADIINMSWGIDLSDDDDSEEDSEELLDDLIEEANNEGIIMVASAGNDSTDVMYTYPANNSDVITVSSINSSLELSSFSNYGSTIDFCAPGEKVYVLYGSSMSYKNGTSFSAPYVVAAAAYMKLLDLPVYDTLKEYAVDINDEGWDEETGYGYIDLSELISYEEATTEETTEEAATEEITTEEITEISTNEHDYEDPENPANITNKASLYTGPTSYSACTHASKYSSYTVLKGIDVSKWQGTIDWDDVAADGVQYAIIRVGYRGTETGKLVLDEKAKTNIKGALAAGIKVGLYFFTQATTTAEAEAEANYVISFLNDIGVSTSDITLPIAMDFEYASGNTGRLYEAGLTKAQATNICLAFCNKIAANGYSAMVYASKSVFEDDLNAATISASYDIWLANYTSSTSYSGDYTFWQFSSSGSIDGISGNVDLDFWYVKDTPVIKSATANASAITLKWDAVSGATGYVIWRRTAGGSWTRIGNTTGTYYNDTTALTSGTTYYYTMRAYYGDLTTANENTFDSTYWSDYDMTGKKIVYLSKPTLNSTAAANGGISVSWSAVSGASGYMVYRKTSGGSWSMLGSTTGTSYTDKTAAAGTTYYYTVRAYTGNVTTAKKNTYNALYWGGYDSTGVTGKYIKMPTISSAQTNANGTALSWSAVSGATGYAVWRRTASGSWSRIGYTTSTSYTDKTALSSGTTYYYTIRAYSGAYATANANTFNSNYWSFYDTTGTKTVYLSNPTLNSTAAANGGINVSWSKVSGASGYMVYRKTSGGSWSMLGSTTGTSYTDKTAAAGTTYYYTVRAYTGNVTTAKKNTYNALYWGGYDSTGVTGKYIKMPTISSAQTNANGTALSWSAVSGATGYAVWRRTASGSWSRIGYTTSTSYTDKTALSSGTTYYYTIRAYSGAYATANANTFNSNYWSFYDTTGRKTVYLSKPTLKSASKSSSGIKVSWNKVSGASGYAIYRKAAGGSWILIGNTTSTSYTDTSTLTSGVTYYYTVRAYTGTYATANKNKYNALYWGGYDSTGITY